MIYGFEEITVREAIMHEVLGTDSNYNGYYSEGNFIERDGQYIYQVQKILNLIEKNGEYVMQSEKGIEGPIMDITIKGKGWDLKTLNSNSCIQFITKVNGEYGFFLAIDDDFNTAEEQLNNDIVNDYMKKMKVTSKAKVEELIRKYVIACTK